MTNKCIKTSLFMREIQIKTLVKFLYVFIKCLKGKNIIQTVGKNMAEPGIGASACISSLWEAEEGL